MEGQIEEGVDLANDVEYFETAFDIINDGSFYRKLHLTLEDEKDDLLRLNFWATLS